MWTIACHHILTTGIRITLTSWRRCSFRRASYLCSLTCSFGKHELMLCAGGPSGWCPHLHWVLAIHSSQWHTLAVDGSRVLVLRYHPGFECGAFSSPTINPPAPPCVPRACQYEHSTLAAEASTRQEWAMAASPCSGVHVADELISSYSECTINVCWHVYLDLELHWPPRTQHIMVEQ